MLVLAAQGRIDYRTFLFANVGDDSEYAGTLTYLHEIAMPYAERHGLTIHELRYAMRDGTQRTLLQHITGPVRSIDIPVHMADGAPGNRKCTDRWKIKVVGKWLTEHGASPENRATVAVGLSVDEVSRASRRRDEPHTVVTYPLFDLGLTKNDCIRVIIEAGLPVPPKSSCWFCPFTRPSTWQYRAHDEPELFARACDLEAQLIAKRAVLGKDPAYFTSLGRPLGEVVTAGQDTLTDEGCDNGWCMT